MAALNEVEIHYRFRGGIETKEDSKAVPATQLLLLENGVFTKRSAIRKRNGYEALSQTIDGTALTVSSPIRFATRGDELLEFTSNRCYSRQSDDQVSDVGAVFSALPSERPLVRTGTEQTNPDHATLSGVTASAWEDSNGGVWWSTTDAASGRIFRAATQAHADGQNPRCVPCGTNIHIYFMLPVQNRIMVLVVNPASPSAAVTPVILTDDLDSTTTAGYDACPTGRTGSPAAIAWFESGTLAIRFGYVDQSGVLGSPLTGHPSIATDAYGSVGGRSAFSPIAIAYLDVDGGAGDVFGIAFVASTLDAMAASYTGSLASTGLRVATSTVDATRIALVCTAADATMHLAVEENAIEASERFTKTVSGIIPASTNGTLTTIRSVGLASRAWAVGTDAFAVFVHDTTYFNTYLSLKFSDAATDGFVPVGRHAPAQASGAPVRAFQPSVHVTDGVAAVALPVRERLISENNSLFRETGIRLFEMDFASSVSHQAVQLGASLYMAGACPLQYDGRTWTEQGIHFGPELIAAAPAGGGSMTSSTTYLYRAWYERTDAQGEVHRGPISFGTLVTMGGSDTQVTLTLPTLRVTQAGNVRIMVARSLAAKTGKTAQLFRVTSLNPAASGANGYVANDPTVDSVSFLDRMSDTDLELQDELYTDGGILSNDPPALGGIIAGGKSRLIMTDPADGNTLRFSQFLSAGIGVEFAPELALSVDPFGGSVTALAARDDRFFVFKRTAIFSFAGDGPDSTGNATTTGFSEPQLLPGDVGCANPASIVLTPQGFLFAAQGSRGIWRLNNDGSLEYVGAPVEAYNGQSIRRATVMPNRTQVMFLTDSGLSLIYDYLFGQWSTATNHEGLDAAVVNGEYHYLRTDGRVFRETIGSYSDAGQRITLKLETAWLHLLEQLQGFQKVFELYLIGTWTSPHQIGIQYQTDYSPQWTEAYWYDATGLADSTGWITGSNATTIGTEPVTGSEYGDGEYGSGEYGGTMPSNYEWRLDVYESCESIQFRFQDFEAEGYTGASFELTEMVLTGGAIGNVRRPMTAGRSA